MVDCFCRLHCSLLSTIVIGAGGRLLSCFGDCSLVADDDDDGSAVKFISLLLSSLPAAVVLSADAAEASSLREGIIVYYSFVVV